MHLSQQVQCNMALLRVVCIVTWRLVESAGGKFDPVVSSAKAEFEQMRCVDLLHGQIQQPSQLMRKLM